MKQDENIYYSITLTDKSSGSGKRCGCPLVITLSILLFLSLMANALLSYFYFHLKLASDTPHERARNFSAGDSKSKHVPVTSLDQIRRCSAGERQIQYKDRLYIFPTDEMTWSSSREKCQELGGDLVIINSNEEHKFLVGAMNTFSNSLHWIGLRKVGWWLWVDETPLMKNLSWWKHTLGDSVAGREECVGYYDGQWVDLSCSTAERRICEISCTH